VDGPYPSKMQISISMDVLSNLHSILSTTSLRSKRFGKAFRTFDALFAFLAAGKLGRAQPKSEKRLQRAESPMETLATQATVLP